MNFANLDLLVTFHQGKLFLVMLLFLNLGDWLMYSMQLNKGYFCHFSKMCKHGHCLLPWQPENISNKLWQLFHEGRIIK